MNAVNERTRSATDASRASRKDDRRDRQTDRHRLVCHTSIYFQTLDTYDRLLNPIKTHFCLYRRTLFVLSRHSIRTLNRFKPIKSISKRHVPSSRSRARSRSIRASLVVLVARDARDDARERRRRGRSQRVRARGSRVQGETRRTGGEVRATSNRSRERGRSSRGTTRSGVSSTTARDARRRPRRDRDARARARERPRARSSASRVESSRFGSIRFDRAIDRTNDRTNGRRIERTNDRCATRARVVDGEGGGDAR